MDIRVAWQDPIALVEAPSHAIYAVSDPGAVPDRPGVYVFGRRHGDSISPLYIGKAENLASRVEQQLNNVRLMKGLENSKTGERFLLLGLLKTRQGQQIERVLDIVEGALIEQALAGGHEILNKQGTCTPVHNITFSGNRVSEQLCPRAMKVRQRG